MAWVRLLRLTVLFVAICGILYFALSLPLHNFVPLFVKRNEFRKTVIEKVNSNGGWPKVYEALKPISEFDADFRWTSRGLRVLPGSQYSTNFTNSLPPGFF